MGLRTTERPTEQEESRQPSTADHRRRQALVLGAIILGALALRLWGADHGLPFVYNPDERGHFVSHAAAFFEDGYNPRYFVNPPAFSYLLNGVFWLRYRGAQNALNVFLSNPSNSFLTGRIVTALLGTLVVWLVWLIGRRLFDARVGLFSAALMAVAFLPTFYAHQALNDVPTMVPVAVSLLGSAGVLLGRNRRMDYVVAGVGLGLACATKYLGGVVLAPLIIATAFRLKKGDGFSNVAIGLGLGGIVAAAAFVIANPFALIDYRAFLREIYFVSPSHKGKFKLGARFDTGWTFYLWALTWGFGWVPSIATAAGGVFMWLKKRAVAALLVPAPILYLLFMGARTRYFGRWLLPIFPFLVVIAGYALVEGMDALARHSRRLVAAGATFGLIAVALAQPLAHGVHSDMVLTRTNTRQIARDWIFRHIPAGSRILVEPIYLDLRDKVKHPLPGRSAGQPTRWRLVDLSFLLWTAGYMSTVDYAFNRGRMTSPEWFGRNLRPEIIDLYVQAGVCWVVTGSNQWGRVFNDADKFPKAIEYYRQLSRRGRAVFRIRPYSSREPPTYDFDLSSNNYRFRVSKPGPEIVIYAIPGPSCSGLYNR